MQRSSTSIWVPSLRSRTVSTTAGSPASAAVARQDRRVRLDRAAEHVILAERLFAENPVCATNAGFTSTMRNFSSRSAIASAAALKMSR